MDTSAFCSEDIEIPRDGIVLRATITRPEGEVPTPVMVMLHGAMGNRNAYRFQALAREFATMGVASLRLDLNGRGESGGKLADVTIPGELADVDAAFVYLRAQPWAGDIALLGHSQGGFVTGLYAGLHPHDVRCAVMLAPAGAIEDNCARGFCPFPEFGEAYMRTGAQMHTYETTANYHGPVCVVHGMADAVIPVRYAQRYHEVLECCDLHLMASDDHSLMREFTTTTTIVLAFVRKHLLGDDPDRAVFVDMVREMRAHGVPLNPRIEAGIAAFGISEEEIS